MSNSKICIVTTRNIFDSPCLGKYENLIEDQYDIIYWDRCDIIEECGANRYFRYLNVLSADVSKLKKIKAYIGYFWFANKILLDKKYDKVIVYPTQAAWLIIYNLIKHYKHSYLLDIRDYAGENNKIIKYLTSILVKYSGITSITSPEYSKFLPKKDYIISHNLQYIDQDIVSKYRSKIKKKKEVYTLSFIGSVRFIEQQKLLIKNFANDSRFLLKYIGRGSEQLIEFCKKNNIKNVELVGQFKREELAFFYLDADMAINVYGNNNPYLDYALSNKLYSAAIMGMPILVSVDTYMERVSQQYGFGMAYDFDRKDMNDIVYNFLSCLEYEKVYKGCDTFIDAVNEEEKEYTRAVRSFLAN